jgi:LPS sulfotransferase NodH
MIKADEPLVITVWPDIERTKKLGPYYKVFIFKTRAEWLDMVINHWNATRNALRTTAACFVSVRAVAKRPRKLWGYIFFYEYQFYERNVAHECAHLAIDYCYQKKKINPLDDGVGEELFATFVGDSVGQIYREWNRMKKL